MADIKVFTLQAGQLARHFEGTGVSLIGDASDKCDFSVCAYESLMQATKDACLQTGTPLQDLELLDKVALTGAFERSGSPILPLTDFTSVDQITALGGKPFILKPALGAGSVSSNPLGYKIFSSLAEFNEAASDLCPDFWTLQESPATRLHLQESVVDASDQALLTICNVYVNGAGKAVFTPFLENWQTNGQPTDTSVDAISEDDTRMLQDRIRALIRLRNLKNCFFMVQFIRAQGGDWFPIDFSYRLDYTQMFATVGANPQYCKDLMRYTYDLIENVEEPVDKFAHNRMLSVDVNCHATGDLFEAMDVWSSTYTAPPKHIYKAPQFFNQLFFTFGPSKDAAKAEMDNFERAVTAL